MFLVNIKERTIKECIVLEKKTGYTIIQVDNEIFGLPAEDVTYCLCDTYESASARIAGCWFVTQ